MPLPALIPVAMVGSKLLALTAAGVAGGTTSGTTVAAAAGAAGGGVTLLGFIYKYFNGRSEQPRGEELTREPQHSPQVEIDVPALDEHLPAGMDLGALSVPDFLGDIDVPIDVLVDFAPDVLSGLLHGFDSFGLGPLGDLVKFCQAARLNRKYQLAMG